MGGVVFSCIDEGREAEESQIMPNNTTTTGGEEGSSRKRKKTRQRQVLQDEDDGDDDQQQQQRQQQSSKKRGRFELNSSTYFLTYSQADGLTFERILACLIDNMDRDPRTNVRRFRAVPSQWIVAQENHPPRETNPDDIPDPYNGIHYHLFLEYEDSLRVYNSRHFDIDGYHADIESGKQHGKHRVAQYCAKDGNYMTSDGFDLHELEVAVDGSSGDKATSAQKLSWDDIGETASTVQEFMDLLWTHHIKDFCLHAHTVEANLAKAPKFRTEVEYVSPSPQESWVPRCSLA